MPWPKRFGMFPRQFENARLSYPDDRGMYNGTENGNYRDYRGLYWGMYWDNGKENGNYYNVVPHNGIALKILNP